MDDVLKVGDKVLLGGDGGTAEVAAISESGLYKLRYDDGQTGGFCWQADELELVSPAVSNAINPKHYSEGMPEGVQVIDIIRAQGANFEHGSVIKYILRWKFKNGVEDLKKAQVYLGWLIEQEEAKSE